MSEHPYDLLIFDWEGTLFKSSTSYSETGYPVCPFKGALDVLKILQKQGYLLAVATGKSRQGLDQDVSHYQLEKTFAVTRCGDEGFRKPHPRIIQDILYLTGVGPDKALMIGDTEYDLIMARQAGIDGLAVSYGLQDKALLLECKPLDCIDDIQDLPRWLTERPQSTS